MKIKKSYHFLALRELSGFGLCRAHAINLGRLIWALAYEKAHNKENFWKSALKHCKGSYSRWVYWQEAKLAGAVPSIGQGGEVADLMTTGKWRSERFIPICTEIRKPGHVEFCGYWSRFRDGRMCGGK